MWRVFPLFGAIGIVIVYVITPIALALNSHSFNINGSTQYLASPDSSSLSITGDLTIEMWAKFDSFNTSHGILAAKYGGGSSERAYWVAYRDEAGTKKFETRISVDGSGVGTTVGNLNYTLTTSQWYHLVFVYKASAGTFDVYVATSTASVHALAGQMSGHNHSIKNSISAFMLGSSSGDIPGVFFDGTMDDVRVWNVARTQAQIDADFKTELTGTEPNLAAYWTFNGGSLEDSTANNNDFAAPQGFTQSADVPFDDAPPPPPPADPNPVIIIPGILGSYPIGGVWTIDPILHTYYDLIATLDTNHYTPGVDLFDFPYNWRESNVDTAISLKLKIEEVKGICACDKVDLVAHSMGGLVARQYIQSDDYEDDVDQLIFLGTPHLGAPKSYLMWEGGETDPSGLSNHLLKSILRLEAREEGYSNLFSYIQIEPIESMRELLPVYDYLSAGGTLWSYPTGYPANPFLEGLNSAVSDLLNAGIDIHNIVGETASASTITGISTVNPAAHLPLWPHGYPDGFYEKIDNRGLERGAGDDTVPLPSASFVSENLAVTPHSHSALPVAAEGDVYQILTGEVAGFLSTKYDSTTYKMLHIKIFSPADLLVIAPDGKKIGSDGGSSVNEIPDAFYTGPDADAEFITILNPLDGDYVIQVHGVGSGPYTVEASYLTNEDATDALFTGNTAPGLVAELTASLDTESSEVIEIQSADSDAPVITIASPQAKDYSRSEQLPVNVSAQDPSGVFVLQTLIGTTTIPNVGSVDLFFLKLGTTTLTAAAVDNVGNAATTTRSFRIIATVDSTLSDIERAYSLGWMTKKVHDTLRKKFNAAVKISKVVGKTKGEKAQKVVDTVLAAAFLKELDKVRGKGLNEQAYQILKEDIQWLIH